MHTGGRHLSSHKAKNVDFFSDERSEITKKCPRLVIDKVRYLRYDVKMKKPTSFLSGYYEWSIYWSKERAEDVYGKTDSSTKTITIYQCESKQIEKETLLHELLHVALEDKSDAIFNYEPDSKCNDKEENLIRLLSPVLMNILADNKDLAKYLFGA